MSWIIALFLSAAACATVPAAAAGPTPAVPPTLDDTPPSAAPPRGPPPGPDTPSLEAETPQPSPAPDPPEPSSASPTQHHPVAPPEDASVAAEHGAELKAATAPPRRGSPAADAGSRAASPPPVLPPAEAVPEWWTALLSAPDVPQSDVPEATTGQRLLPLPSELMAHGPDVAWRRFLWVVTASLVAQLCRRVGRRRPPGPIRLFLVRLVGLARAVAALAALGTVLALLPTRWLPWVGLVAASAAIAVGWSLRPLLNDGLSGLYLGIMGRHTPGTPVRMPDTRGTIHLPGPLRTVVRTESGALQTIPNRHLGTEPNEVARAGRTAIHVELALPMTLPPRDALAAIQWACTLLPWTGEEPAKVRPPGGGAGAMWSVEMVVLGVSPPIDQIRAVFFDLVHDVLRQPDVGDPKPTAVPSE